MSEFMNIGNDTVITLIIPSKESSAIFQWRKWSTCKICK